MGREELSLNLFGGLPTHPESLGSHRQVSALLQFLLSPSYAHYYHRSPFSKQGELLNMTGYTICPVQIPFSSHHYFPVSLDPISTLFSNSHSHGMPVLTKPCLEFPGFWKMSYPTT